MTSLIIFEKKVNATVVIIFFLSMLVLFFFDWLPIWASAMASLFIAVTLRQFLIGRLIDIVASALIFGTLFVVNSFYYSEYWTGITLIVGAGYIFIRQCFEVYAYKTQFSQNQDPKDPYLSDKDNEN